MINYLAFLVGFLFSVAVFAAGPVSFSLYGVALPDLARVVVDDVAGASLIVSPEVVEDRGLLDFALKNASTETALVALERVVRGRGYELVRVGSVFYLEKPRPVDDDVLVYLPKYRGASYLADLVGGIIPRNAIVNQRMIGQPGNVQGTAAGMNTFETGTNVNSLLDKGDKDTLVIKGTPRDLAKVRKMLAEVDRPVPEMLLKAVVLEVQTGGVEGSAVSLLANLMSKGIGSASASWKGGTSSENNVTLKIGGIEAVWSAISSDSRFKIVSAPQVRVKSGSSARFSVGSETPVLGAVNYQGNGQSVQSVEYKPSGVILELKPEIRGELAELKVFQQLSSFAKTETGVNNSPTLLKRELSTSVVVSQNDVVLLGGLDEEKTLETSSGFFFLPSFLRSKSADKGRSEIVLMLYVERVQTPGEAI